MIKVRIGTGSFEKFDVQFDTDWPLVPVVGASIIQDEGVPVNRAWKVIDVVYKVTPDGEFIGVLVLVKEIIKSSYDLSKF